MPAPRRLTRSVAGPGARRIAYLDIGPEDGIPVLYCHGAPSSPHELAMFTGDRIADQLGLRIVAPARPGVWLSDAEPGRAIAEWPGDAWVVLDACGIDRFALLGYSAGGAYAAAVGAAAGSRVTGLVLAGAVDHRRGDLAHGLRRRALLAQRAPRRTPRAARLALAALARAPGKHAAARLLARRSDLLSPQDAAALLDPATLDAFVAKTTWAFARDAAGPRDDLALMTGPWSFEPSAITAPTQVWQGTADLVGARPAMARRLHAEIPGSELVLVEEGHLSLLTRYARDILAWLRESHLRSR